LIKLSTKKEKLFSKIEFGCHLPNGYFKRGMFIDEGDLLEKRKEFSNTGIYKTIYSYQSKEVEGNPIYGPFYLDFDAEMWDVDPKTAAKNLKKVQEDFKQAITFFEVIYNIPREYARTYYSGKKGLHLIYPPELFAIEPREDLNRIFKLIKDDVCKYTKNDTVDQRIYDNKRLFRVTNSRHQDTGLYKVPAEPEFLLNATVKELHEYAKTPKVVEFKEPRTIRKTAKHYRSVVDKFEYKKKERQKRLERYKDKPLKHTPPCIDHLLKEGARKGYRNNSMAALTSFLKQKGLTEDEVFMKIKKWGKEQCVPPIPTNEIRATVPSVYSSNKNYGCAALKELSECDIDNCKLVKN